MKATAVGYMQGTDPIFLSRMVAQGIYTMPLGNGVDNHGKYIALVTKSDNLAMVVGHFHKFIPPFEEGGVKAADRLYACRLHEIPVLILCPSEIFDDCKKILGECAEWVTLLEPDKLCDTAFSILDEENAPSS